MSKRLPPFSGDDTQCPKCSHIGAYTEWRSAETLGRTNLTEERLRRRCTRCDYEWDEALNPPAGEPSPDCDDTCANNRCGECGRCLAHQHPAEGGCYPR